MHKLSIFRTILVALLLLLWTTSGVLAQEPPDEVSASAATGTTFTYQGNLADGGSPANGVYDFEFALYDAVTGGTPVGSPVPVNDQTVTAGLFSVGLDFGKVFDGQARWLQINVRPGASTSTYTALGPRQPLTGTPYALYALDGWGGTWTGTGTGLTLTGGTTGLFANGTNIGVNGQSDTSSGIGVLGWANATSGDARGVEGVSESTEGKGVYGLTFATSGSTYGVYGESRSTAGTGVYGLANSASGSTYGVFGESASPDGRGVEGYATATSGTTRGVYGISASPAGTGVYGESSASSGASGGVQGRSASTTGTGVYGFATATSGTNVGVYGQTASAAGYAGYFVGKVSVLGTLSKTAGTFKIDHPLDPENKYLYHSFVESPDMKNIYDGVAALDENGTASIHLADWFEALNQEFRYQLTPIGAAMPDLYIAQEITDNGFQIAGGAAGMKVSWQVTGIRHDPYAEAHRIQVEEDKSADERGTYLFPELYGQPAEMGLDYQRNLARQDES